MYQHPPPNTRFPPPQHQQQQQQRLPPPQNNNFQGNGSFPHGMPPNGPPPNQFPARPPMPEDFLPLHEFPPKTGGGAPGNPAAYQQHPDPNRMMDYQNNPHIINNTMAMPQKFEPNGSMTDVNHNQEEGRMPLGTADYTKIVQALETLKTNNVIASTPPQGAKYENELEVEPISPHREDKKAKKQKRKKEKKKKEKKLEE